MGLLDNFERGLERVVNGAFAKTFKSGLQPLEITSALRRELDTKAAVVSRDRILVPNRLRARLSPSDHQRMAQLGPALIDEFTQLVQRHAAAQHYTFAGPLSIRLEEDPSLTQGVVQVDSSNVKDDVVWTPVLEIDGRRHPLTGPRTVIGRGSEADLTIADTGASRRHAEVLWDGERAQLTDLDSTNGTKLNGNPVRKAALHPDSVIQIGRTRLVFRLTATAGDAHATHDRTGAGEWNP